MQINNVISNIPFVCVVLIERIFPWLVLAFFIKRKKIGWVFIGFFSLINIMSEGFFIVQQLLLNGHGYKKISNFLLINDGLAFTLAAFIIYLLSTKTVVKAFHINMRMKWGVVVVSIIIFILAKHYMLEIVKKIIGANEV